ncbi:MAG TPA: anti-sigma factor, partial [Actinomycetota bacterium]|nr:anti-sigma factor [Actinomycetota bacterium]
MPELAPHPHPDLGGYVLGALEPAERADFEEHLAGCERCQAEVAELRGLPELLEQAAPPVEVPPSLRERTFAAVERAAAQQRRRRRLRLALTAVAACLVLVVAFVGGYTLSQVGPFADRGRVIEFALAAPDGGPARATAKVRQVGDGLAITMEVSGLAPNPPGSVYECWYVGPGDSLERPNRVSAGTFTVG